jgi:hypothetical protein
MLISVVNSVIGAAIVALVALLFQLPTLVILVAGVLTFVAVFVAHGVSGQRNIKRGQRGIRTLFPTAADE